MSKRRKKVRGNPAAEQDRGMPAPAGSAPRDRLLSQANRRAGEAGASNPKLLVYALLGVTVFMFVYLHLYAMPQMTYFAGGLSMPGARLMGYDVEDVERLRGVMDSTATGQLSFLHKTAGIIFPLFLFLSSWAVAGLVMRRRVLRWCVVGAAGLFAVVDITENFLIDRILTMEPLDPGLVALSSALTSASWVMLLLVAAAVVGTMVMTIVQSSLGGNGRAEGGSDEPGAASTR